MWTFIKLAWRNVLRNKRRTILAGTAIGIGLAALIFTDAFIIGMEQNMVRSATSSFLGEGQIHQAGFRETLEVDKTINNLEQVTSNLKKESIVKDFTLRTMAFGMITSAANVNSINLIGINPDTEKNLSQIDDAIIKGKYFSENEPNSIVIGKKLAENLEVDLEDRVVVTVAQAKTGDLSQEMFRISGIYYFNTPDMDSGMAFIPLEKSQEMLGIGNNAHEIAIKFTDIKYGQDKELPFWSKYSQYGNETLGWIKIFPELEIMFKFTQFSIYVTAIILFGVVAFGIINTLFMSLYERMFEFGVLRAIGTGPFRMAQLILLEAGSLAIISIICGSILGFIITYTVMKTGIDYRGIEMVGVTIRDLIYPVLTIKQFVIYPFWLFLFTIITALYPALYAARISPAKAMRKSF
jgi:ABC-type lipoprotein release transport system permease subunit